ncbi:MAG: hypothetical protein ACAI44_24030 [Candidatus Sericytochromatia bacterium]
MGHETLLYGAIVVPGRKGLQKDGHSEEFNRQAIASLPLLDTFPFLTRDVFAYPAVIRAENSYQSLVIPFGLSLKSMGPELETDFWLSWRQKFEKLLRQMCWQQASVQVIPELYQSYSCYWTPDEVSQDRPIEAWTYKIFRHSLPEGLEIEAAEGL